MSVSIDRIHPLGRAALALALPLAVLVAGPLLAQDEAASSTAPGVSDPAAALAAAGGDADNLSDQDPSDEASASAEGAPAEARTKRPVLGPKDGKYLVDDEGREYWVEVVNKGVEGRNYRWVDDKHVRLYGGLTFEVVDHDEETFSLKFLKPVRQPTVRTPVTTVTQAEKDAAAKSYETEIETVDRLELVRWDKGLPRSGQWRHGLAIADMNNDGHLDIVHGPARKGRPQPNIFLGDGQGNWTLWQEARYPSFPFDYGDVAVGDFDNDGNQDMALGMHLKGLMVLRGDGEGNFVRWSDGIDVEIPGQGGDASTFSSREIETVDWNRDGRLDIIAFGEGPKATNQMALRRGKIETKSSRGVVVFLNNGNSGWSALEMDDQSSFGDSLSVANLNGDEIPDFVTSSSLVGYPKILHYGDSSGGWVERDFEGLRPRAFVRAVTTLQVDDDELADIAVGYVNNDARVWRSGLDLYVTGGSPDSATWQRTTLGVAEGRRGIFAVDSGDLDGDGLPDIVASTGIGELWVFLGANGGTMVREASPEVGRRSIQCRGYSVRLHDLDGDGRDEIVAGFAGETSVAPDATTLRGCPGNGSLEIYRVVPKSDAP
ncbi:MAG: VCBS repeat-containing protein [Acidobacteriota bacterium]